MTVQVGFGLVPTKEQVKDAVTGDAFSLSLLLLLTLMDSCVQLTEAAPPALQGTGDPAAGA